jgi:hypothetical protein
MKIKKENLEHNAVAQPCHLHSCWKDMSGNFTDKCIIPLFRSLLYVLKRRLSSHKIAVPHTVGDSAVPHCHQVTCQQVVFQGPLSFSVYASVQCEVQLVDSEGGLVWLVESLRLSWTASAFSSVITE